uniref:Protein TsetseEP domain-containing protein n=1 Tax=Anopheles funestus TaxID=62324 RepID=A0A182R9R4_ANOFN
MMSKAVLVVVLVCLSECLATPAYDPLDYLPTLEYLRNVLRFSILSFSEVKPDTSLPLTLDITPTVRNVSHSFTNALEAADKITDLVNTQDISHNIQPLVEQLQQINSSFYEAYIHYPEYYRKENASQELELLKRNMSEHLKRLNFKTDTLQLGDLREINSFLTDAASQAMSTTVAVFLMSSVEKLQHYLKVLFFPPHMEASELKELHDITQVVRSYHELYGAALRTASERFLREASDGRELLQSANLPEALQKAVTEFSDQVDNFIQTGLSDLQSVQYKADNRFGEVLQNILYTSYGLVSSGMGMLRPFIKHLQCVRDLVPRAHTVAAISLLSVSLCSNEATTPLYDATMVYHDKIRQLHHEIFEQLQKVDACAKLNTESCSSVYDETLTVINTNVEVVQSFTIDFEPYRNQLLNCLTLKYETQMAKVLDMSLTFDKCVKTTK